MKLHKRAKTNVAADEGNPINVHDDLKVEVLLHFYVKYGGSGYINFEECIRSSVENSSTGDELRVWLRFITQHVLIQAVT